MKDKIKRWYCMGLWEEQMVRNAVAKGIPFGKPLFISTLGKSCSPSASAPSYP